MITEQKMTTQEKAIVDILNNSSLTITSDGKPLTVITKDYSLIASEIVTKVRNLANPDVSGSASDFERELYKLINAYVSAGLKKPDLVHKIEYVAESCRVS